MKIDSRPMQWAMEKYVAVSESDIRRDSRHERVGERRRNDEDDSVTPITNVSDYIYSIRLTAVVWCTRLVSPSADRSQSLASM